MTEWVFHWQGIFHALLLLLVANGGPVIAWRLCGRRFAWPVDAGWKCGDGRPLLGRSKTWRGVVCSVVLSSLVARFMGYGLLDGAFFGTSVMIGDALASFVKRRKGLVESSRARGLDTLPESLLPLLIMKSQLALSWADIAAVVLLFFLIEEFISPILYRLHIRKRPY